MRGDARYSTHPHAKWNLQVVPAATRIYQRGKCPRSSVPHCFQVTFGITDAALGDEVDPMTDNESFLLVSYLLVYILIVVVIALSFIQSVTVDAYVAEESLRSKLSVA